MVYALGQMEMQLRILQHIQAVLPVAMASQIRHCLIKDKKILIYMNSAAWASQVRFYENTILAATASLKKTPCEIMQIRVMTDQTGLRLGPKRMAIMPSKQKIENIRNHGLAIEHDQLASALLKLSTTLEKLSGQT
jgi:hypothetical protein